MHAQDREQFDVVWGLASVFLLFVVVFVIGSLRLLEVLNEESD